MLSLMYAAVCEDRKTWETMKCARQMYDKHQRSNSKRTYYSSALGRDKYPILFISRDDMDLVKSGRRAA